MKFYTSDLHFFHKRICEFTDRKLFANEDTHNDWLINLWNNQVQRGDLVYILGDVSFAKDWELTKNVLNQLNGQKIIIKGNHDSSRDLDNLQIESSIVKWDHYEEVKIAKVKTCLFHFPIQSWNSQSDGSWHLFGHTHGNSTNKGKCLDVGIDSAYNIFGEHRLFTELDIEMILKQKETYVSDLHRKHQYETTSN